MNSKLYPLKFSPKFSEKIWGGNRLKQQFEQAPDGNVGEAWLLSDVPGNETPIANGPLKGQLLQDVIGKYSDELFGKGSGVNFSGRFPLLFKVIDARDDLSVQVHPDDDVARVKHNSAGKTEMWYILDHEPGAALISGFDSETDKEAFSKALQSGSALEQLKQAPVNNGDCFFIPAGRVHAIGKGILLAEIQQTSDVTYRVYDFDRVDDQGNTRELHIEDAAEVLNYKDCDSGLVEQSSQSLGSNNLVTCSHFKTDHLELKAGEEFAVNTDEAWVALMSIAGKCDVETAVSKESIDLYDVMLVPAVCNEIKVKASEDCHLLVVR